MEQTRKKSKAVMTVGVIVLLAGVVLAVADQGELGGTLMLAGFAAYAFGRWATWWQQG